MKLGTKTFLQTILDEVAEFLRVRRFPLPILIPPKVPYLLIILSLTLYSLDSDNVVI
jgi:hypothetical protein